MEDKLLKALFKAVELVKSSGKGEMKDAFVERYGQIIKEGKLTEKGLEWARNLDEEWDNKFKKKHTPYKNQRERK